MNNSKKKIVMLEFDREVLKPYEDVAQILGISVKKYIERIVAEQQEEHEGFEAIADRVEGLEYRRKKEAETVAGRFEICD